MTLRRNAGFTLIELVVVLAIIGLSLGVAIALFAHAGGGAMLSAATREVRTALRDARSTAITENRRVVFRGDPGNGYWLDRSHFSLATMNGVAPLIVAVRGGAQISFFPSGGSSGGLVLVTSGGLTREIAVDAMTGRADEIH
jgi:general secretion pathway protein H